MNHKEWWLTEFNPDDPIETEGGYTFAAEISNEDHGIIEIRGRLDPASPYMEEEGWEYVVIFWRFKNASVLKHFKKGRLV